MEEQILQRKILQKERHIEKTEVQLHTASGIQCPQCGALNEPGVAFCENCGAAIGSSSCPYCGAEMMPKTDYCESCHRYAQDHICSFCGGSMTSDDYFCSECGAPREGIICPVCHARNLFPFCSNCGTPLTESARQEQEVVRKSPLYREMCILSEELERLQLVLPVNTGEELQRRQKCEEIRQRVRALLAAGPELLSKVPVQEEIHTRSELEALIAGKRAELQQILNLMAMPAQTSPAVSRRYAMARKPMVSRLGWLCNFKHEVHASPHECACPQMGGKWIVLDGKQKTDLKTQ